MALITIPFVLTDRIDLFEILFITPFQIVHQSPYTLSEQVYSRGSGTWQGRIRVSATGYGRDADAYEIESFFASLNGLQNWTNLPLLRKTLPTSYVDNSITITRSLFSNNLIQHQLSGALAATVGSYVHVGSRLCSVKHNLAGNIVELNPQIYFDVGTGISSAPTILVRSLQANQGVSMSVPGMFGPWEWEWMEKL